MTKTEQYPFPHMYDTCTQCLVSIATRSQSMNWLRTSNLKSTLLQATLYCLTNSKDHNNKVHQQTAISLQLVMRQTLASSSRALAFIRYYSIAMAKAHVSAQIVGVFAHFVTAWNGARISPLLMYGSNVSRQAACIVKHLSTNLALPQPSSTAC